MKIRKARPSAPSTDQNLGGRIPGPSGVHRNVHTAKLRATPGGRNHGRTQGRWASCPGPATSPSATSEAEAVPTYASTPAPVRTTSHERPAEQRPLRPSRHDRRTRAQPLPAHLTQHPGFFHDADGDLDAWFTAMEGRLAPLLDRGPCEIGLYEGRCSPAPTSDGYKRQVRASRSSRLRILPLAFRGRVSVRTMRLGALKPARRSRA